MMPLGFSTVLFMHAAVNGALTRVCPKLIGRAYTYKEGEALMDAHIKRYCRTLTEDEVMAILFTEALLG